jgi:hypothetical protein
MRPVTLVQTQARVYAFAQDGGRVAWVGEVAVPGSIPYSAVYVRAARPGAPTVRLTPKADAGESYGLALGGGRALWWSRYSGMKTYTSLGTASVASRRTIRLEGGELVLDSCGVGRTIGRVSGDGGALVYSLHSYRADESAPEFSCATLGSGYVARVTGGRTRRIPGVGQAAEVAVSGSLLAVARASVVELRDIGTGALRSSCTASGFVVALALTREHVAAMVRSGGRTRIELCDPRTGALLQAVAVPRGVQPALSASEAVAVFSVARDLYAVDLRTYRTRWLGRAAATPIGLSVEGRRVAWAENVGGRGRIRVLTLL